ncbi:MAG: bifunctional folylpolyglutamate synthase/dihydrofolate synthase [Bacteroidetes bacterium]|nr:MAG: bifunctional folylpolyglutamate synthase/dihydrofolate synthase [Bacteroidota bacterium]
MNYQQTLDYMFSRLPMFHRIGAAAYKANLDNTLALSSLTGNPHLDFRSVHIAGTNGKGSVSHMLASVFQESGYKTALFTSPHLKDYRERIKINGHMIPETVVADFVGRHIDDFERIKPSFFEMTFGLAMKWFSDEQVDIAVIETGMGGRLDSTNVITPMLSVITNIGLDHTRFLGNTIAEIAVEKGGIIKPGIPVVIGETHPESAGVFRRIATDCHSTLLFADKEITVSRDYEKQEPGWLNVKAVALGSEIELSSPLTGIYQLKNIATVLAATQLLSQDTSLGPELSIESGIRNTLVNTGLQGRWQTLRDNPLTICDIGHNPHGIQHVVEQIRSIKYRNLHFVIGVVDDKDISAMLVLLPAEATYYFCKADIPRGLDANLLMKEAMAFGLKGRVYHSVKEALNAAWSAANNEDMVFVGGSAFTVAEVI